MKPVRILLTVLILSVITLSASAATMVYEVNLSQGLSAAAQIELNDKVKTQVIAPAMKEVAGVPTDQAAKSSGVDIRNLPNGLVTIAVTVNFPAEKQADDKTSAIFDAIRPKLDSVIKSEQDRLNDRYLRPFAMAAVQAQQRLDATVHRIAELRSLLRKATDRIDVSPEGLRQAIASLDQEHQRLALEQAGLSVRQKALQESIAKISIKAERSSMDDPAANQLQALVKTREAQLQRIQELYKQGATPMSDVSKSESDLSEAKFRLLERQSAVSKTSGGDILADLNKDLINLSIAVADNQARLDYVGKALARLAPVADNIDELEALLARRAQDEAAASKASTDLRSGEAQLSDAQPPRVLRATPENPGRYRGPVQ